MAMAEAKRQSDALPSIAFIDLEKIKREHSFYNSRHPTSAAPHMSAPPLVSPSSMYSGPPPPYSYPSSTTSSVTGGHSNGYIASPTESRHILNEDQKEQQQATKQSLPSIHEALTREPLSITSLLTNTTPAPLAPSQPAQYASSHSPTSPGYRPYREPPSAAPASNIIRTHSSPNHHPEQPRSLHSPRPVVDTNNSRHTSSITREPQYPPMLPPRTIPSPAPVSRPSMPALNFRHSSPAYESVPRSAPTMNPPHAYTPYSVPCSYPPPISSITTSQQPPSPSNVSNWRYGEPEVDRSEEYRRVAAKESIEKRSFGEAVKRHLDSFDLETSLNEIAEGSGRALDFSRHYSARAHQTQRSGPVPGSMPSVAECDEMMSYQKRVLESMQSIKEVIIAQQQALVEQRNYEHNYKPASEADEDGALFHEKLEGGGGFAGADPKKRRGDVVTAATEPKHRNGVEVQMEHAPYVMRVDCVSSNSRAILDAAILMFQLDYAKLTRKMGSKPSATGSNLRPKELSQGSP
ncbi:MAG: hypothetical protein Q9172_002875 [Xanthocarpia lactea]